MEAKGGFTNVAKKIEKKAANSRLVAAAHVVPGLIRAAIEIEGEKHAIRRANKQMNKSFKGATKGIGC